MGDINKLLTYANLQSYDTLIKSYISDVEAESLHKVLLDSTNGTINFYKDPSATLSDTADFTINIPANLDSTATIATASNGVVTLKAGLVEADGIVTNSSDSDIVLAKVATTGAAEDVSYDNTTSGLTADDLQSAVDELAQASQGGVASKTVWFRDTSAGQSDYAKVYKLYQGVNAPESETSPAALLGTINIPKDEVLQDASIVTITYSNGKLYDGAIDVTELIKGEGGTATEADAGKYMKFILQNVTNPLYANLSEFIDIYVPEANATQIQLAIDSNNVISAEIVDGSVDTDALGNGVVTAAKLATDSVTTVKIADDAVTADKVAIAAHTESVTAGADGIAISVTTTDGQVSGVTASIAAQTYDSYGAASAAVAALDSNTNTLTATSDSSLAVITEVGITDGLLSSVKTNTLGSAATHADTDFMASADYTLTTESEIEALFD